MTTTSTAPLPSSETPAAPVAVGGYIVPGTMPVGPYAGRPSNKILVDTQTGEHVCSLCGFRESGWHQVLGHMSHQHRSAAAKKKVREKAAKKDGRLDLIGRLDGIAADLNDLRREVGAADDARVDAAWKKRALDAERRLATLRRALGSTD